VAAVRAEALTCIDAGEFDGARALLAAARHRIRDARPERAREEAQLLADEAGIDRLEIRFPAAAVRYAEAAELVSFDEDAQCLYLMKEATALLSQGDQFVDLAALTVAIDRLREVSELRPRAKVPLQWAATQTSLGHALRALGEREAGTARLAEAVDAYRAALEERTQQRVPLQWAATQISLGHALRALGEREAGTARLAEAVDAYRAALEVYTRNRVPVERWALLQHDLGSALWALGERDTGGRCTRVEEAAGALRCAVDGFTALEDGYSVAVTGEKLRAAQAVLGLCRRADGMQCEWCRTTVALVS
jgi:tetratricopeptide (TPR) repeat protein